MASQDHLGRILREARMFSMSALIYYLVKTAGMQADLPNLFVDTLRREAAHAALHNLLLQHETMQILQKFEVAAIEVMPIKGIFLAVEYFGELSARSTTDIDLVIRPTSMSLAIQCLEALGYKPVPSIQGHFHTTFCKRNQFGDPMIYVELHWNVIDEATAQVDMEDFWRVAVPFSEKYLFLKKLPLNETFYLLCLHGISHKLDSPRYLADIMFFLSRWGAKLDLESIFALAKRHKTYRRTLLILNLTARYISIPAYRAVTVSNKVWDEETIIERKLEQKANMRYYLHQLLLPFYCFDNGKQILAYWYKCISRRGEHM